LCKRPFFFHLRKNLSRYWGDLRSFPLSQKECPPPAIMREGSPPRKRGALLGAQLSGVLGRKGSTFSLPPPPKWLFRLRWFFPFLYRTGEAKLLSVVSSSFSLKIQPALLCGVQLLDRVFFSFFPAQTARSRSPPPVAPVLLGV